ncbi:PREDICTED: UDP-glucuronosyltransferase 2B4-like [Dipodomys ordii]|uniref:UDP-glucuronosyltransferase 2B4-like n=1 Tax=Dipodomys ordii TaxID=10020 RepID=A0A1S3EKB3_DIPOR|nr:PREDICTED: UDP-glucuronosyltransferase 2B4-like [Dipodomys ordii]
MASKVTTVLLLLQLSGFFVSGKCGKVLVWPMEFSHWINLKIILDELVVRGHEVTVLVSSTSIFFEVNKPSHIKFEIYPSSISTEEVEKVFLESLRKWIYELPKLSFWTYFSTLQELIWEDSAYFEILCKDVALNKKLMTKLQESRFDVVLADAFIPCGDLLAELLNLPLVYTHRFFPGYTYEKYMGGLPVPPSYVPIIETELSDRMTFMERVKNMLYVIYFDFWFQAFNEKKWNQLYSEVLGRPTTLFETMGKADIWLIRTYWDIEFPRPLLPNFEFVGGLHCKPARPLPKEMEDFVQSSGDNGIVVFSLGSMVGNMTEEKANVIASALAQIPQKVVWRFDGKKPDVLGSNTQLYKWIPQNDLLVLVSLCFSFSYKENAMRLSRIHHDQPVKPLDRAVFWIEFVMRHKGAKHLRPAVHELNWFQYHALDVIGFLLACVAALIFIFIKCCMFCCQKLGKTGKKNKRE